MQLDGTGLKTKDLCGIPWRVAFALQADGWYLRSDIVWAKPNPMPESVTDRPTKAHEYVFLLTKSPRYFFDQEAVREAAEYGRRNHRDRWVSGAENGDGHRSGGGSVTGSDPSAGRNIRSVWEIATQPYPEAHFATFPEALPERCIKAGTSERGCCPECGAPWEREIEDTPEYAATKEALRIRRGGMRSSELATFGLTQGTSNPSISRGQITTGWRPSCGCPLKVTSDGMCVPVPCTVLDPFMGSGTTALVARRLGRRSIGIELNPEYAALCARRLQQLSLFAGTA
jgi:hypothetical protein